MTPAQFERIYELFEQYCSALRRSKSQVFNGGLAGEIRLRLAQLEFACERVRHAQSNPVDFLLHITRRLADRNPDGSFRDRGLMSQWGPAEEAYYHTEAFYHLAWRTTVALQLLPGFKRFDPIAVRNVRNHLVEHPEKGRPPIYTMAWTFDNVAGPRLRSARPVGEAPQPVDAGFWSNVEEFQIKLEACLARAVGNRLGQDQLPQEK